MKTTKATPKSKRGQRGLGRLYIRTKDRKQLKAGSSNHNGSYWLEYWRPITVDGQPDKKKVRCKLKDTNGQPITSLKEAEAARDIILRQFVAASKEERTVQLLAELEQVRQEHAQAVDEATPPTTIAETWEAYTVSNNAPETGRDTIKYYAGYWKAFREWIEAQHAEAKFLRDITPVMVDGYVSQLKRLKLSPNTHNKHTGFLKLLFKTLDKTARLEENPFGNVKKRKLNTHIRRELTISELRELIDSADGELKTLLLLGSTTGLRLGDCATLRFNEIDFARRQIRRIPNKLRYRDNATPIKVGIPPELLQRLLEIPTGNRKGYVLPEFAALYTYRNASGRPTRQPEITKRVQAHFIACGIQTHKEGTGETPEYLAEVKAWIKGDREGEKPTHPRAVIEVGFHSLRHTYVSLQAERGVPQSTVQAIVGHGSPAMTAHYHHTTDKAAEQATLELGVGVKDAEYERLPDPLPDWAVELVRKMTVSNWEQIKTDIIGE